MHLLIRDILAFATKGGSKLLKKTGKLKFNKNTLIEILKGSNFKKFTNRVKDIDIDGTDKEKSKFAKLTKGKLSTDFSFILFSLFSLKKAGSKNPQEDFENEVVSNLKESPSTVKLFEKLKKETILNTCLNSEKLEQEFDNLVSDIEIDIGKKEERENKDQLSINPNIEEEDVLVKLYKETDNVKTEKIQREPKGITEQEALKVVQYLSTKLTQEALTELLKDSGARE